jgi:hypothetical protein
VTLKTLNLRLSLCLSSIILLAGGFSCSQPSPSSLTVAVDAQEEWQNTGMVLSVSDNVVIEYLDGEWTNWLGETQFFGPGGGSSFVCDSESCVEPLIRYPQGGLIGRIGFSDPFAVGEYLAFTADSDGMLQLRMNDIGTYDNKGSVLMHISLESENECSIGVDAAIFDFALSIDFTAGCI